MSDTTEKGLYVQGSKGDGVTGEPAAQDVRRSTPAPDDPDATAVFPAVSNGSVPAADPAREGVFREDAQGDSRDGGSREARDDGARETHDGGTREPHDGRAQRTRDGGSLQTGDGGARKTRDGGSQGSSGRTTEAGKGGEGAEAAVRTEPAVREPSAETDPSASRERPEKASSPEKAESAPGEESSGKASTAEKPGAPTDPKGGTGAEAAPHRPRGPFASEDDSPTGVALFKAVKTPPSPAQTPRPFPRRRIRLPEDRPWPKRPRLNTPPPAPGKSQVTPEDGEGAVETQPRLRPPSAGTIRPASIRPGGRPAEDRPSAEEPSQDTEAPAEAAPSVSDRTGRDRAPEGGRPAAGGPTEGLSAEGEPSPAVPPRADESSREEETERSPGESPGEGAPRSAEAERAQAASRGTSGGASGEPREKSARNAEDRRSAAERGSASTRRTEDAPAAENARESESPAESGKAREPGDAAQRGKTRQTGGAQQAIAALPRETDKPAKSTRSATRKSVGVADPADPDATTVLGAVTIGAPPGGSPVEAGLAAARPARAGGTATETATPSLSVVVVSNSMESELRLTATVGSLQAQEAPPDEIILVIDHCPELYGWARLHLDGVRIVHNEGVKGTAAARNAGLTRARCDVVAFLDDETTVDPDWTVNLLKPYEDPDVIGVRGRVSIRWSANRPDWFPSEFAWVVGTPCFGSPQDDGPIDDLYGTGLSFRRTALLEAGGFPEALDHPALDVPAEPTGGSKAQLASLLRARHPEGKVVQAPSAVLRVSVSRRRARLSYLLARCLAEGRSQAGVPQRSVGREGMLAHQAAARAGLPRALLRAITATGPSDVKGWKVLLVLILGLAATNIGYIAGRLRSTRTDQITTQTSTATWFLSRTALPLATVLWGLSLREVDLDRMTDLGLITVMPFTFWAAMVVMTIGFVALLGDKHAVELWHAGYVVVLIAVLHATPALLYPTLRYSWAWKHVSIIDYLIRHSATDPENGPLAAYHQWPGFFSFFALLTEMAGLENALRIATWGPAFFNLATLLPLLLLYRTVTRSRQLVWGGIWVYFSCSWVGQDYFSPQATTLVLYLILLAVMIRRFRRGPIRAGDDPDGLMAEPPPISDTRTRFLWALLMFIPIAGIASSHQLTPLMLVAAMAALWTLRRHRNTGILLVTGIMVLVWDLGVAWQLLESRMNDILASLGDAGGNLDDGLISLGEASTGQVIVAYADRALSGGLWLLAVGGALLRRRWVRRPGMPLLVVGLSPLLFLAAGSYGGEIIFRAYLFALPLTAFLAAAFFLPTARTWVRAGVLPAVFLLMVTGFFFGNYGKEHANYFTSDEVALMRHLYRVAPEGSLIVAPTFYLPAAYDYYERYEQAWLDELPPSRDAVPNLPDFVPTLPELVAEPAESLVSFMSKRPPGAKSYLVLNRAQRAATESAGILPSGTVDRIQREVEASDRFKVLVRNSGGVVYVLDPGGNR